MSADQSAGLHVLVLAAGAARRFGSPKQLARIGDRPLLPLCVGRATQVGGHAVTVVLGAYAADLTPLLRHSGASVAINRDWEEGMASSIRAGLAHVSGAIDGVLIMLADQPDVSSDDLARLVAAWRRQPDGLAAATYGSSFGVPAIFPRWCLRELHELRGETGARSVLHRHLEQLTRVAMPSAAFDIDTPEDLLQHAEIIARAAITSPAPLSAATEAAAKRLTLLDD